MIASSVRRCAARVVTAPALVTLLIAVCASPCTGKVLLAKDEALALAFPGADRVEERVFILTDEQKATIEKRAKAPLETQLWTFYVGWRGGAPVGYALIDTHVVRTLPETCMTVISPSGDVERVEILAFHEPPEYQPPDRWLRQFDHKNDDAELRLRGDIQGITGATLTATATTAAVRRALALYAVLIDGHVPSAPNAAGGAPTSGAQPSPRAP